jgi:hypothetical protein
MWIAEQINSFLDLGICKEYPNMAKSKSISSSKANRTNTNLKEEQTNPGSPTSLPDVKTAGSQTPAEIAAEARVTPGSRKLEAVKTEPRKNVVVPINRVPNNLEDEIRRRAYEIYLQHGPGSGSEAEDWLTAEREIKQRYHQQSA